MSHVARLLSTLGPNLSDSEVGTEIQNLTPIRLNRPRELVGSICKWRVIVSLDEVVSVISFRLEGSDTESPPSPTLASCRIVGRGDSSVSQPTEPPMSNFA